MVRALLVAASVHGIDSHPPGERRLINAPLIQRIQFLFRKTSPLSRSGTELNFRPRRIITEYTTQTRYSVSVYRKGERQSTLKGVLFSKRKCKLKFNRQMFSVSMFSAGSSSIK